MAPPILTLQNVGLGFGGSPLFRDLSMSVAAGERAALIGRNGAGKSTLLKVLAGEVDPDAGERWLQPGTQVVRLVQEPDLSGYRTIGEYVVAGAPDRPHRADMLLHPLGLDSQRSTASLSGGETRRAALARVLAAEPDVLLLDEPTNHLDIRAIEWLEKEIAAFAGAVIVISHDRTFLARATRAVFWLDRGEVRRSDQGLAAFEAWQEDVYRQEEEMRARLDKRIAEETRWSHEGISARRRRNQGRLRRLHEMRAERSQLIQRAGGAKLNAESGKISGKLVIEAEDISKAFDGRTVIGGFSTRIQRGDKVGLIGPNGAGKTTLLRMLTGDLQPDSGRVRLGANLTPVYLDQQRARLDDSQRLQDVLCPAGGERVMVGGESRHVISYMKDFLFDPSQARQPVSALSGGERNRLLLARALSQPSNLLILDEPTNDLDMETLDLLQEMLADYDGTLLLVSHDRDFLDRVVTSTIVLEGDGSAEEYPGGYSDYLRQRGAAPASDATKIDRPRTGPGDEAAKAERPRSQTKLSYKDQRRLDALPGAMEALQAEIVGLESRLSDPQLFSRDPAAFNAATARLGAAGEELAAMEEEWLELEARREELAGS
jgi:ATP-binding cassette subfamily F protein uup